jgi:hypothetical protein
MANLEKRIVDLEAQAAGTDHFITLIFCAEGEDAAQARLRAGVPPEHAGKVVCVQFVESPNAWKERPHADA